MESEISREEMLRKYVSDIVRESGITNVDEEQLAMDLSDEIDSALIESLPDESLDQLVAAIENPNEDSMNLEQIIDASGIDQNAIIDNILKDFHDSFIGGAAHEE